jgi:DNA-binding response OmpR family regulator
LSEASPRGTAIAPPVVVFESDPDAAEELTEELSGMGFLVLVTGSLTIARRLTRDHHPRAVIVDLRPGDQVERGGVQRLTRDCRRLGTRIVAITGLPRLLDEHGVAGQDATLIKPFPPTALRQAIMP